jgi:copper homeostasis protein
MLCEVCVDSLESAAAAQRGGAGRLELCSSLSEGGLTPTPGLVEGVLRQVSLPVFAMLRPRRGDFCYSPEEIEVMRRDLEWLKTCGVQGVVLGLLTPDGQIDRAGVKKLVDLARPLNVTFHRAFDLCADPYQALDELITLGVERLLTSGQQPSALEGLALLQGLTARAAGRMVVMPGGGVNEQTIRAIVNGCQAREIHFSASAWAESCLAFRREGLPMDGPAAPSPYILKLTDPEKVRRLVSLAGAGRP